MADAQHELELLTDALYEMIKEDQNAVAHHLLSKAVNEWRGSGVMPSTLVKAARHLLGTPKEKE